MLLGLIFPIVLALFGDIKMIAYRVDERDSYREFFRIYMLSNFVLSFTIFISIISFLKVHKLVILREAALRHTAVGIVIVILQLAIAIVLMLSVKPDYFELPLAAQLGLLVPFGCMFSLF